MSTREASLWKWLKEGTRRHYPDLDLRRVENGVERGTPDVEGCWKGWQFWIELKCCDRPKDPDLPFKVRFEPAQLPWLRRRTRAGGSCWVLLQLGSGQTAVRYLVPGFELEQCFVGLEGEYSTTERRLFKATWIGQRAEPTSVLQAAAMEPERWRALAALSV